MTPTSFAQVQAAPMEIDLSQVEGDVVRLVAILTQEFESLKTRDLASFDLVQEEKNVLLQRLVVAAQWATTQTPVPALWQQLQDTLQQCKQDHLRNVQLLQRQLQAVRGALQVLQGESVASVDLYDRQGQIAHRSGSSAYSLA